MMDIFHPESGGKRIWREAIQRKVFTTSAAHLVDGSTGAIRANGLIFEKTLLALGVRLENFGYHCTDDSEVKGSMVEEVCWESIQNSRPILPTWV